MRIPESVRWVLSLLFLLSVLGHLGWYLAESGSDRGYHLALAVRVQMTLWCVSIALGYLMNLAVMSVRYRHLETEGEVFESALAQALIRVSWWGLALTVVGFYGWVLLGFGQVTW